MISLMQGGGRLPLNALALALGIWIVSGPAALADGDGSAATYPIQTVAEPSLLRQFGSATGLGTLGYGPPGLLPGFQGFGLGYHPGYGFGGKGLGVGADGGYPFYAGPGYPSCEPRLRRIGGITPFPYFGGPGYPTPDHPNYFGGMGPLVPDPPVITIGDDRYDIGYGPFTGAIPYPESFLAPFTARAAAAGSGSGVSSAYPSTPATNTAPAVREIPNGTAASHPLGIDVEPVVDTHGVRGLKVSRVNPGTAAEKAGLHAGDVIHSINGYLSEQPGNLAWILAHAAPNHTLTMNVRSASNGEVRVLTAQLP